MSATAPLASNAELAALRLAEEYGIPVFPCRPDKRPYTAHGFQDASTNISAIETWWRQWPDALIGVPTGRASRIVVVDVDPDGAAWYREHADRLDCGRVHQTRRGHHLLYRAPAGVEIGNSAGKIARGIDIRAEGGYIIWWPAHGFEAVGDLEDLTEPPPWLLELLVRPAAAAQAVPESSAVGSGKIGAGRRNDFLSREAYRLRKQGATVEQIGEVLSALNAARCEPALGTEEVRRIAVAKARIVPQSEESPPSGSYAPDDAGFADTDIANAKRFACQHGENVRFTPERGWFVWDGRRWEVDDKFIAVQELGKHTALAIFDEVKTAARRDEIYKHARKSQGRGAIEAMIHLARSEPGIPARLTDFDADAWLFNVANGTLELRTGTLREHRRTDLISNVSAITYDPEAECELWDAFVWRVTDRNDELYAYLRRLCGYLLVGDVSEQALHFLHGTGSNGKSVFCEVLQRLLGDYATVASPDLVMLKRHASIPNDVARLRGVRAVFMNETSQGSRFDEAKLKDLTGGDTLTARFLHQEFFDFRPTHRILIRGNHKPNVHGTDDGIWRRLRMLPFAVQISDAEQDPHLLRKLEAELPGILNWALAGTADWQQGGLRPPAVVVEAARQYREESDTLGRFLGEHCQARTLGEVRSSSLFRRYQEFAEQAGERWLPARDFPAEMERRGFQHKRGTGGQRLFVGIEFRDSELAWAASDAK